MATTATATDEKLVIVTREQGQKGVTGDAGTDAEGFNEVRKRLLDAPLVNLLEKNKFSDTYAGTLTATRSTTATYIDRYGVLQNAAINEMRQEAKGWLLEGASTNLFLQSQDFSTTWAQGLYNGGASDFWTMTTNTGDVDDPYGTNTADKFVATATPSIAFGRQSGLTLSSGTQYTLSCWIYVPTQAGVSNWTYSAIIDGNTRSSASPSLLFDQWVRAEVTITTTSAATAANIEISEDGVTPAAGFTFYAFGAQCENLNFASSYIPTTTTTVTRAADDVQLPAYYNAPRLEQFNGVLTGKFSITFDFSPAGVNYSDSASDDMYIFTIPITNSSSDDDNVCAFVKGGSDDDRFVANYSSGRGSVGGSVPKGSKRSATLICNGTDSFFIYLGENLYLQLITTPEFLDTSGVITIGSRNADTTKHFFGHISNFRIYDFALNEYEWQLIRDYN